MAEVTAGMVKELREKTGVGMMACKEALVTSNGDFSAAITLLRERGLSVAAKKASRESADGRVFVGVSKSGKVGTLISLSCETDFVANNADFVEFGSGLATAMAEDNFSGQGQYVWNGQSIDSAISALVLKLGESISLKQVVTYSDANLISSYIHSNGKIGVIVDSSGISGEVADDIAMHIAASSPLVVESDQLDAELMETERGIARQQAINEGKPAAVIEKIVSGRLQRFVKENSLLDQPFVKEPEKSVRELIPASGKIHRFTRLAIG